MEHPPAQQVTGGTANLGDRREESSPIHYLRRRAPCYTLPKK